VAGFRLTQRAEEDLAEIGAYTLDTWGAEQCARYLDQLEACCERLAEDPRRGRACDELRPGYRRRVQGKHVLYFKQMDETTILIVRVLHESMLPELHLGDGDEP
jgi:toxin ParE1/3/4